jgi:hypothetical protein
LAYVKRTGQWDKTVAQVGRKWTQANKRKTRQETETNKRKAVLSVQLFSFTTKQMYSD